VRKAATTLTPAASVPDAITRSVHISAGLLVASLFDASPNNTTITRNAHKATAAASVLRVGSDEPPIAADQARPRYQPRARRDNAMTEYSAVAAIISAGVSLSPSKGTAGEDVDAPIAPIATKLARSATADTALARRFLCMIVPLTMSISTRQP
jgi:hypothetical protein